MAGKKETVVISVGGSLIVPDDIDISFLKKFRAVVIAHVKKGRRFVLVVGGGKTARRYMNAAPHFPSVTKRERDMIGITAILPNAHLIRLVFKGYEKQVVVNPDQELWEPGSSSDVDAVNAAEKFGVARLINLSNIDYVYTADPKKDKKSTPIKEMSWKELRGILPPRWDPGLNAPFDPVAARTAQACGLEVIIMNGKKLNELKKYLDRKPFRGTIVRP